MVEGCRTGYFQFDSRNDGLYIIVYPPQNGGRTANIDDVMFILIRKRLNATRLSWHRQSGQGAVRRRNLRFQMRRYISILNSGITG